jgi:hypothetical protein
MVAGAGGGQRDRRKPIHGRTLQEAHPSDERHAIAEVDNTAASRLRASRQVAQSDGREARMGIIRAGECPARIEALRGIYPVCIYVQDTFSVAQILKSKNCGAEHLASQWLRNGVLRQTIMH